jgi:hypothetical protein
MDAPVTCARAIATLCAWTDAARLETGEAEGREPARCILLGGGAWRSAEHQRERDVLDRGELGKEEALLEDEAERLPSQSRAFLLSETGHVHEPALSGERDGAGVGPDDAGEAVQQGRLA